MTTSPATYVARPVAITAMRFIDETINDVNRWLSAELGEGKFYITVSGTDVHLHIETREGEVDCPTGYWVVKGTQGEFYPCADDVFSFKYQWQAAVA